jgi:hypothetical protein
MPCLLDIDDVDFEIFAQRAKDITRPRWQRLLYAAQSSQIETAFQKWAPKFNGLWVAKANDTQHTVARHAAILPNIPYNAPAATPPLSIGWRARMIRQPPGAGKRSLASRSWDMLTTLLRFTTRAGLRCARFGLGRVQISKSWRAWLSGEHASRRSSRLRRLFTVR